MKTVLFWVFAGALLAFAVAEDIENTPCDTGRDANILGATHQITVTPCPGAADEEPCLMHKGSNATITIRFTPSVNPKGKLKSTIAWVNGNRDMTFRGMRPDACQYLPCPVRANQEITFSATLSLSSTLPDGTYPLKVKVQELRGGKQIIFCQLFTIKLADPEN